MYEYRFEGTVPAASISRDPGNVVRRSPEGGGMQVSPGHTALHTVGCRDATHRIDSG